MQGYGFDGLKNIFIQNLDVKWVKQFIKKKFLKIFIYIYKYVGIIWKCVQIISLESLVLFRVEIVDFILFMLVIIGKQRDCL